MLNGDDAVAQRYQGDLSADEVTDFLSDLVNEWMNLHAKVYSQVQKKVRGLED